MKGIGQALNRPHPLVLALSAAIGATGVVFYLQYRAAVRLNAQAEIIAQQISEQTASDIATELRNSLEGPIVDTLEALNPPDIRAGRLDLVESHFAEALDSYPYVERFFQWTAGVDATAPEEVLFFDRSGTFMRDEPVSAAIVELAHRYAPTQRLYIVADRIGPDRQYETVLRLFWSDARRVDYFAVLGFLVERTRLRSHLLGKRQLHRIDDLFSRRGGQLPLRFRVVDEDDQVVFGPEAESPPDRMRAFAAPVFLASSIQRNLAAGVSPRQWTIQMESPQVQGLSPPVNPFWDTALAGLFVLVAFALSVQVYRRSAALALMQADFVAHVSHQLKTPLSLLSAATETLQMDRIKSPEKLATYLNTIRNEVARLSTLVQQVLEFSRVQQRRGYEFELVDLGALVGETTEAFALGHPDRRLVPHIDRSQRGPFVFADPAAIEQVIANLLDNAVKYSDSSSPITVRVGTGDGIAIVEVIDRGIGIPPAERDRVFDRFYRTTKASHRPGFGLGLSIVRELVRAHRGRVRVTSSPGVGSTFHVELPRVQPDERAR